jgi:choline-sulfatase
MSVMFLSCSNGHPGDVLLITVDTLRPDHLGLYGYPRNTSPEIDRWFAKAAIFERAYSAEANTSPSIASILSGLLPQDHRVRLLLQLLPDETPILPDLLPEEYVSAAFVSNPVLTDESMGMAHRFDHYDDFVDEDSSGGKGAHVYERRAAATTTAALKWLRTERDPRYPLFLWVHYIDPHFPYNAPESSRPVFQKPAPYTFPSDPPPLPFRHNLEDRTSALRTVDRYDEEIHYVDREVGRLFAGYGALFPMDRALVAFTADHGESMLEHEIWFAHGYHVYDEIVQVPLMLMGPGVEGGRRPGLASGVDLATSILAFAGASPPKGSLGIDLRTGSIPSDRAVFAEATRAGHWRAVVQGAGKWVLQLPYGEREIVGRRYYQLDSDPLELSPQDHPPATPAYRRLNELVAKDPDAGGLPSDRKRGMRIHAPKVAPTATEGQLERLRALGYVE